MRDQAIWYQPSTGTDVVGKGIGPDWTRAGAGVVSHPALGTSYVDNFRRTRITSAASIDNELGVRQPVLSAFRGNAQSRGGFYFTALFKVNAIPNNAIRLFVGLSASGTAVCTLGTGAIPDNTMGLFCDETDNAVLSFGSRDATAQNKETLTGSPVLTAGTLYEWIMLCNPNQATVVTQLRNAGTDTVIRSQNFQGGGSLRIPLNTVFMAPQVGLSNAANAAGGDTAFDIYSIYLRPNLRLVPGQH